MDFLPQNTWKAKFDSLQERIESAYKNNNLKELPSMEEIERLVEITNRGFRNSKFYDYIMHKNIKLRNNYIHKRNRMLRSKEQLKEDRRQKSSYALGDKEKLNLISIVTRLARENGIGTSDEVSIELDRVEGHVKFIDENTRKAFDWSDAILSKATSLFPEIVPLYSNCLSDIYERVRPALSISVRDSYDKIENASSDIDAAFRRALNDEYIYKIINEESDRTGASKQIIFLKLLEEEDSIRKFNV